MFLNLLMMDPDMKLLDAFMACTPSDFPGNELPTRENAGPVMLRMGLERLRSADPVLFDDSAMIHTDPLRPHGRFEGGIDRLRHLKDLWPLTYGFQAHRRALLAQYLNTQGAIWSWQGYIDGMTALRADTLEAIEAYAAQVEERGMVFIPRLSREPYVTHAAGKEPPTWTLGPPK